MLTKERKKKWMKFHKEKRKRKKKNEWKKNETRVPMKSEKEARLTNEKAHQTILIKQKVKETNEWKKLKQPRLIIEKRMKKEKRQTNEKEKWKNSYKQKGCKKISE